MRIGQGYDVHRLVEGRELILGGVKIPYEKGLLGHSDADVLVHAVMDALLGAAALGDIGQHFPDTDPRYEGILSICLLEKVGQLLDAHHYVIENIDATIIAQRPKLAPYRPEMAANIASALSLKISQVSVKATTEEGLGFTGTGEGIASQAIVLLTEVANYCYYGAEDGGAAVSVGPEGPEFLTDEGAPACRQGACADSGDAPSRPEGPGRGDCAGCPGCSRA